MSPESTGSYAQACLFPPDDDTGACCAREQFCIIEVDGRCDLQVHYMIPQHYHVIPAGLWPLVTVPFPFYALVASETYKSDYIIVGMKTYYHTPPMCVTPLPVRLLYGLLSSIVILLLDLSALSYIPAARHHSCSTSVGERRLLTLRVRFQQPSSSALVNLPHTLTCGCVCEADLHRLNI